MGRNLPLSNTKKQESSIADARNDTKQRKRPNGP